jgi:hypothetical protein
MTVYILIIYRSWKSFVEDWLFLNKPENQELIVDHIDQFGVDCLVVNKADIKDEEPMRNSLKQVKN